MYTSSTPPLPLSLAPPPTAPLWGPWCVLAFLSSFGVYTQVTVYVKCVACEFSANVECVPLAATGQTCGQRPLVESPEFGWPGVEAASLWSSVKGLWLLRWELGPGARGVSWAGAGGFLPLLGARAPAWPSSFASPLPAGSGFGDSPGHGEGTRCRASCSSFSIVLLCFPALAGSKSCMCQVGAAGTLSGFQVRTLCHWGAGGR